MKLIVWIACLAALVVATAWTRPCAAYPWMIRHEYTGCAVCHTDPSGGFLTTEYGRAQTQTLLSTFGRGPEGNEVDGRSQFLLGAVKLPQWLNLGASVRDMYMYNKPSKSAGQSSNILMQSDLRAMVNVGSFEAAGSLGYQHEGGQASWVTSRLKGDNLVSREFWVGYNFDEEKNTKVRIGRMYLPFGIRMLEHTLFVKQETQTDLDSQEQYGASLFHGTENYRAEIMAIFGNYQLKPDKYRQRGYSAYFEYAVASGTGLGLSSLLTYAGESQSTIVSGAVIRGAHGPYLRWAPISSLALLTEWDIVHLGPTSGAQPVVGLVGFMQADLEPYRGIHVMVMPEMYMLSFVTGSKDLSYRGWLGTAWFPYPHFDVRVDGIYGSETFASTRMNYEMVLGQVHLSL
jgi:hypothetical protein